MNASRIDGLRATVRDILGDAVNDQEMLAEATGEAIRLAIRNEYAAGVANLDGLVDHQGRFIDDEARTMLGQTLAGILAEIPDEFPLKRRRVQALLRQINGVAQVSLAATKTLNDLNTLIVPGTENGS